MFKFRDFVMESAITAKPSVTANTSKSRPSNLRLSQLISKIGRRELLAVFGLTVFGCLLRIALIPYGGFITSDGVYYATLARNLLAGDIHRGLSTYWPPLYPVLIAIFDSILHDPVYAGRVVSALAGGLLVIPVYLLARRFTGSRAPALVAAIFVIFEPSLFHYSLMVLTESVFTLLFISGILMGWLALEGKRRFPFFLCGLLFGLAYLLKPEAMGYILLLSLIVAAVNFVRRTGLHWVASSTAFICLGALLAAAPYLFYLRNETGRWTLSEKFGGNVPGVVVKARKLLPSGQLTNADVVWAGTESEPASSGPATSVPSSTEPSPAPESVSSTFLGSLKQTAKSTLQGLHAEYEMISKLLSPLVLLLIGAGLFARPWSVNRLGLELYICAFVLTTFLGYAFAIQQLRYLVPLTPLALCWAAVGAVRTASWLNVTLARCAQGRFPRFHVGPRRALTAVTAVVVLNLSVITILSIRNDDWDPRQAAEWIRSQGVKSPLIMATGPWPAFYAGGRHLYIPNEEFNVVLAYAKRKKIDFLVVQKGSLDKTPTLAPLLEGNIPAELSLVYEYGDKESRLLIFRLKDSGSS
jgi:4-amino-4-deoxy-L-arabinose transferase-like glycosyltransferase